LQLANGKIKHIQTPVKLNALDCHLIGIEALNTHSYRLAIRWLSQAYSRVQNENNFFPDVKALEEHLLFAIDVVISYIFLKNYEKNEFNYLKICFFHSAQSSIR